MEQIVIEMKADATTKGTVRYAAAGSPVPLLYVRKEALGSAPPERLLLTLSAGA
jgi:hypothetical protein